MKSVLFIANNNIGRGLSGGDRIFSRLIAGWKTRMKITLLGSEEAVAMAEGAGKGGFEVILSDSRNASPNPYTLAGMTRHIMRRIRKGCEAVDDNDNIVEAAEFVYSVSDAYPDLLPAWRIKRRYPSVRWIAGYYLFIPHPFHPDNPYKGSQWLRGVAYWMLQIYSYRLVRQHADYVFVTSEPDVARFVTSTRDRSKIIVIRGGVDVEPGNRHFASGSVTSVEERDFDACFLGRFHYQKGVLELMDIWKMVMEKRPGAKLVVIGEGPLEKEMREKIATCGMKENVAITGFLDGEPKYEIFRGSRIMVHPATYDSGGMAAAEGMAWALPGVSFDLEALKTYYPKGMLKTQPGNLRQFADNILRLLEDRELYDRTAREARDLVLEQWDWNKRADDIYDAVFGKA